MPNLEFDLVLYTNRNSLPAPLVNALNKQHYSRGASRVSVTQLIDSPRISLLRKTNEPRIEVDASDRLWALMGTALHSVLEAGADEEHLPEERLFAECLGWVVSGGIDLQRLGPGTVGLRDYKLTSVWSVVNPKPAWANQLNCYAWLIRKAKGWDVEDLEVIAILRDWQRNKARHERDYPQTPIVRVPIPLLSADQAAAYVRERVRLHQDADRRDQWAEPLPLCTPEERWAKPTTYAVVKPKRKAALRVFHDFDAAGAYASDHTETSIVVRPGASTRCAGDYCSVSRWCSQWKAEQGDAA